MTAEPHFAMPPTPTTPDERTWATIAHVGSIVAALVALAFLGPLIVLLVKGNESPFIRRHAVESLNFQITSLIALFTGIVVGTLTFGIGLLIVVPLGLLYSGYWIVAIILASLRANEGKDFRYPLNLRLVS